MTNSKPTNKQYEDLANAIITQAAEDYREARLMDDRGMVRDCIRFFKSEWFVMLSDLDGNALLWHLKNECDTYIKEFKEFSKHKLYSVTAAAKKLDVTYDVMMGYIKKDYIKAMKIKNRVYVNSEGIKSLAVRLGKEVDCE